MYIKVLIDFILFVISFKKVYQSYIIYPFKKSIKQLKIYPEDILQNDLEITIEIGTPPQKIDLNLRSKEYTFFISSSDLNLPFTTFNRTNSNSFTRVMNFTSTFNGKEYKKGFKINESIIINNEENKNISLIYATEISYNESGALGLKLLDSYQFGVDLSFIYQIKNPANFDNYSFSLKYDEKDDEKGHLLIGSYPHIYDSKNYFEDNFYYLKTGKLANMIDWVLDFDIIKYNDAEINNIIKNCSIRIEFGLIQAPFKLKEYFKEKLFFGECNENYYSKRNIHIINCSKSFNISKFKDLSFTLKVIEYEFVLTYKDVFIERENDYIFGIVFDGETDENKSSWIFGKLFMKKYQLFFDLDRKIIGIYKNNNKKGEKNKKFNIIIYIIVIIFLVLVSIGLVFVIVYLITKQRKNKAYELKDDNFDYIPSE